MENKEFIKVRPEEVGITSESIISFLNALEYNQVTMHSVILIRYGKCAFEQYYAPYKRDTLHRMFSVSKSFTSLGIGLLEAEGKLCLDDKIVKYFPDMLPKKVPDYLSQMTIRDMLRMMTCYKQTTYNKFDNTQDWVKTFFNTVPDHRPGTIFSYDTSASHTLAALIERLSGKKYLDYLREKFLDEIGFSEKAYMVCDPVGIPMGGTGLMAAPMDLAKVAYIVMNNGRLGDKQLLPFNYIKEATKKQVDTSVKAPTMEEACGYGYQIWRIQHNGFAFYGMGGQLAICLPDYDFLCVTTADTQGRSGSNQFIYNSLYTEILPYLKDYNILEEYGQKSDSDIKAKLENCCIKPLESEFEKNISLEDKQILKQNIERINGKKYKIENNDRGFMEIRFEFLDEGGNFYYTLNNEKDLSKKCSKAKNGKEFKLPFGFGNHKKLKFPYYNDDCITSGVWLSLNTLYLKSHLIGECVGSVHIQAVFDKNDITLFMRKTEETYYSEFDGYLSGKIY